MLHSIILYVFLASTLVLPSLVFAQSRNDFLLSERDTKLIINEVQKEVSRVGGTIDILKYSSQEQAALTLLRSSARDIVLRFLPAFVATETIKVVLHLVSSLEKVSEVTIKEILDEIEKQTVGKAVEIGNTWLLQNEVKTGSGTIEHQKSGWNFQYLLIYKSTTENRADIVFEFYSPERVDSPLFQGSMGTFSGFLGDSAYIGKVNPFVIHIETKVEKSGLGWTVDSSADTKITVEFPEKVPVLKLAKEWPYPLEEQKINLLNTWTTAKKVLEYLRSTGSEAFGKAADFAHKVEEITKGFIEQASRFIGQGGAGLINPLGGESQQLDAIEDQLNLVKDALEIEEDQAEIDETKLSLVKDEPQPVENLVKLSFPQVEQSLTPQLAPELEISLTPNESELNSVKEVILVPNKAELSLAKDIAKDTIAGSGVVPPIFCSLDASLSPQLDGVIFHEIGWMGTSASGNDEWMKLKNVSGSEALLEGWQLLDKDKQIAVVFGKDQKISSQGIFVLERTDDSSLPNAVADFVYTGALNNTEETVYLFDKGCKLRDRVAANPSWPAGENESKKPMERGNDLSWYTQGSGSSFPSAGSISIAVGSPPKTYPKILISEIQTAGAISQTEEFMELYNPTDGVVDLTDWYIQKKTQGSDSFSTFVSKNILSGKTIQAKGYFLIAREDSSFASSADVTTTYSLADNNTLVIKNPNGEIVDKIGWGDVQDAENTPALNPQTGRSLNRVWDATNQTYYDRDNNSPDFTIHNFTSPKAQNIENAPLPSSPSPPPPDITPPQVTLNSVAASQSDVAFSFSWSATDPQGSGTPSGVQSIFVEYTVTPSVAGVFARYNNNGVWTNWQAGSAGKITLSAQTASLSIRAQDGVSYTFQVSASDVAGNTSATSSVATAVTLSKTVVVNEIGWMGTTASTNDEWIELYNTTNSPISLAGWTLTADDGTPSIQLVGTIGALSYFLLERTLDTTVSNVSADQIYTGALENEGEYLRLSDASNTLVDAVDASAGWMAGDNTTKQSMERVSASQGGSKASNWVKNNIVQHNGKDAGTTIVYGTLGNWINGTPRQANSTVTSPTTIADGTMRFDEFSTITLTNLGSPYIAAVSIIVPAGKTLIVEPGVQVKFQNNAGYLTVQGTIQAQGTQTNGITFTVIDGGTVWCGIRIVSPSTASQLDYVTIDKAKSLVGGGCNQSAITYSMYVESSDVTMNNSVIQLGAEYRKLYLKNSNSTINASTISGANLNADSIGIYVDGGSPTISNSTISNNSIGIFVNSLSNTPTIQNNTFTGNTYAMKLDSAVVALSGNTATNNTYNGIYFEGAIVTNTTWQAHAIPYIVSSLTVNAGTTLTIQAGVVVKFIYRGYINNPAFVINGTLVTQGTAENPVVFTTTQDDTVGGSGTYGGTDAVSSWKRIYIAPGSTGSQLTYTTLKNGGNTYYEAALYVKQSDVQLSNVTISNSAYSGIYSSNGAITGSNVTLSNNTYGFHIELGDCPILTNTNVTANVGPTLHPSSFPVPPCSF